MEVFVAGSSWSSHLSTYTSAFWSVLVQADATAPFPAFLQRWLWVALCHICSTRASMGKHSIEAFFYRIARKTHWGGGIQWSLPRLHFRQIFPLCSKPMGGSYWIIDLVYRLRLKTTLMSYTNILDIVTSWAFFSAWTMFIL